MSNPELLEQLRQLSDDEQVEIIQILTAELANKKGLKSLDNRAAYRLWSPYDYSDAAQKLMSLLEQETADLAKEEGIVSGNEAAEIIGGVHTSYGAAEQLMQLLECEKK